MRRIFKMFLVLSAIYYVAARLQRRTGAPTHTDAPDFRGISDVDPEPLTQFGEAVDPEALKAAHAEPVHLDQLPRPGKNLPS